MTASSTTAFSPFDRLYTFRTQPWRSLYIAYRLLSTLLFRLPFWFLIGLFPWGRVHPQFTVKKALIIRITRIFIGTAYKTTQLGKLPPSCVEITPGPNVNGVWIQPRPDLAFGDIQHAQEVNKVRDVRVPGYWYEKDGVVPENSPHPVPGEKVAYFIHGGAFVSGSAHPSQAYAAIPNGLLQHCPSIKRVFALEYRLLRTLPSVEGAFPAMILDSLNGYMHLVELGYAPEDIILVGDSAGGNLALSLCRYLVEYADTKSPSGTSLPRIPGALILLSPWGDVGDSYNHEGSKIENKKYDYIVATPVSQEYTSWAIGRSMGANIANANPWVSPISKHVNHVSFKGFPRTFIAVGGLEVLRDQVAVLKEKMEGDIGEDRVEYYFAPLAVHDFILLRWHEPERTNGLKKIAAWLATL